MLSNKASQYLKQNQNTATMGFWDRPTSFPSRGSTWMTDNIDWLKEYSIRDVLCLPGSHNAGMDRVVSKTDQVTEDNVKCQTGSIGE